MVLLLGLPALANPLKYSQIGIADFEGSVLLFQANQQGLLFFYDLQEM
jgi:hypothetical protein